MRSLVRGLRIAVVLQDPLRRAKLVLEGDQAFVLQFGAPKIDAFRSRSLAFLDELPEEKRHAAELMESPVRTSVFVNDAGAVPQREQRGNRRAVFPSHTDVKRVAHVGSQVSEPVLRLRRQVMAPPGDQHEGIERLNEYIGAAHLVGELFLFRAPDFSLNGILV